MAMRLLSWLAFGIACYLARSFYGVIMGTFIFSFVGNSVVALWERQSDSIRKFAISRFGIKLPHISRQMLSVLYIVVIINAIFFATFFTVPQIITSWRYLKQLLLSDNPYVELANSIHSILGPDVTMRIEVLLTSVYGEPSKAAIQSLKLAEGSAPILTLQLQQSLKGYVLALLPVFNKILRSSSTWLMQVLVSLFFSFICIFDKARIQRGVQRLGQEKSIVSFAYNEIAPRVCLFGRLIGKSLEAQLLIALWNTMLTTAGLLLLDLPGAPFFSILVFVCSFIPLAGVILSTLPMGMVALSESGELFEAATVHAIEAYFLNPQIYSSKLKLHPLLVLIALYVTEHVFGIGALFLAVPITVFVIKVLLGEDDSPEACSSPKPVEPSK
ncbi:hypothetical protein GUITHDRAFT_142917 [Guillardia theta CCMP2712]|uniref:AI-2E family transporter n=1 Tax=Guillardia theta (strain CCMP2712) TaxID=905079 RepID=L1IWD8_GUITC|nr:hypothetical protein GUITHDRAFT_142917 [Guillardia theta CCMP2712]EKX40194.1 hypothetical protein GUITHDRAFT_142917 [Guillardia theta CCMP2712]|eukprot:XP_005827174.1 hypothetical protein GUITHDRAFT_142917 [Guillardia theta CCMP2712]